MSETETVTAVYMRGGTSKGVFLHDRDLPPFGPERDDLLLRIMGSPDPMQIDGMGGTYSSTSKVIVVAPGPEDAITYWFAQIGIDTAIVDWSGNCGNLTTAVAPFAIDEGLIATHDGVTRVRLINGNTGVEIEAEVQTRDGVAVTTGSHVVAGVPGAGSPVATRYLDPAGGVLGSLLPTGQARDVIETVHGPLEVSIVDAAHPNVFVRAVDVGLVDDPRSVAELNADAAFLARIEAVRAAAAVRAGSAPSREEARELVPAVPRIVLVEPATWQTDSVANDGGPADIRIIAFSMGKVHRGLPMTGALCLTAAATIDGTLVAEAAGGVRTILRVQHPLGVTEAEAQVQSGPKPIRSLGVVRTARRLMEGKIYPAGRAS